MAASVWLAEDILMTGHSASFNDEGLRQFIPVVKASSKEDVYVHTIRIPYNGFWDPITGACAHPNVIIGALDIGKVILYPPGVDFNTYKWLKEHKFDVVEADKEEHLLHSACNIITLGPGKVIMNAFAKRAIQQVRGLGGRGGRGRVRRGSQQHRLRQVGLRYIQAAPRPRSQLL